MTALETPAAPEIPTQAVAIPALPASLTGALAVIDRRRRLILGLRGLGETVALGCAGLVLLALNDGLLRPGTTLREALGWGWWVVLGGVALWRALLPALRQGTLLASALVAERALGMRDEVLSTAVQFVERPPHHVSAWMVARTVVIAAQRLADAPLARVVPSAPAWRAARWAVAGVLILGLGALLPGGAALLVRAAWPASGLARPSQTSLQVAPGDGRVALGDAVTITASAAGPAASGPCTLQLRWDDGAVQALPMPGTGGSYAMTLEAVTRGFSYQVTCGDAESRRYQMRLNIPPRVEQVALHIIPPAYTHLPQRDVHGGDARVISGSRVVMIGDLGGEVVSSATVQTDAGEHAARLNVSADRGQQLRAEFQPTHDLSWHWHLVGANGAVSTASQVWLITVVPDAPPVVVITAPQVAAGLVAAQDAVDVHLQAADDLGLAGLMLQIASQGTVVRRPVSGAAGRDTVAIDTQVALGDLALHPGDSLTVTVVATDSGGQSTISAPLTWTVVSPEQAQDAQLAARLGDTLASLAAAADALQEQSRSWSALARSADGDDPQERRGELVKIRDQAMTLAGQLHSACVALAAQPVPGDDLAPRLAQQLSAWAAAQGEQAAVLSDRAMRDRGQLAVGLAVSVVSGQDLERFRHDVGVLLAATQGVVLQAQLEATLVQLQKPPRGAGPWQESAWSSGLLGAFHAGTSLSGAVLFQEVGLPVIDNRQVPGIGAVEYSARWQGEILLPTAGAWDVQATVDDGVRILIDGTSLLPDAAWGLHPPTTFTAPLTITAGWHPVVIDYLQDQGLAKLSISCVPHGQPPTALTLDRLRCHGLPLVAPLAGAPAADAPSEILVQARAQLLAVPDALSALGGLSGNDAVGSFGVASAPLIAGLITTPAVPGSLPVFQPPMELSAPQLLIPGQQLLAQVVGANAALAAAAAGVTGHLPNLGSLADVSEGVARLHDLVSRLSNMPASLIDADRLQAAWQTQAAAVSWAEQLQRAIPRNRRAVLAEAQEPDMDAGTCRLLSGTSRHLGLVARQLLELAPHLAEMQDPHADRSPIAGLVAELERSLTTAQHLALAAEHARLGPLSAQALALLELITPDPATAADTATATGTDPAAAGIATAQLVQVLARLPPTPVLVAVRRQLQQGGRCDDPTAARSALTATSPAPVAADPAVVTVIADGLAAAAARFAQASAAAVDSGGESAALDDARLEAWEAAVALAAESSLLRPSAVQAARRGAALAQDLARFSQTGHLSAQFTDLATRAQHLLAPAATAAAVFSRSPLAEALAQWAEMLGQAAQHPARRARLRSALAAQQGSTLDGRNRALLAAAQADVQSARQDMEAARRAFATAQRTIAQQAEQLSLQLSQGRAQVAAGAQPAFSAAASALAATGPGANALAQAAARENVLQLAGAAAAEASRLDQQVVAPLASAFALGQDRASSQMLATSGQAVMELSQQERQAATLLDQAESQRLRARNRLADVLAGILPLVGATPAPPAGLVALGAARRSAGASMAAAAASAGLWQAVGDAPAGSDTTPAIAAAQASQVQAVAASTTTVSALAAVVPTLAEPSSSSSPPLAPNGLLAAGLGQVAGDAEGTSLRLAQAASPWSAADEASARRGAQDAADVGEVAEAAMLQSAAGLAGPGADGGAGSAGSQPAPDAPHSAVQQATRTALALIASDDAPASAYAHAAAVLAHASEATALADALAAPATAPGSSAASGSAHGSGSSSTSAALDTAAAPVALSAMPPLAQGALSLRDPSWTHLAEDPEQHARSAGLEHFDAEDQQAIRAYLRRLGDQR